MVEETGKGDSEQAIDVFAPAAVGQHVGRRGADIGTGDRVIAAGDLLSPSRVGAIAAIGGTEQKYSRGRASRSFHRQRSDRAGHALAPGQVYDVKPLHGRRLVSAHGGIAEPHHAAQDTVAALIDALDACATADLIVFSGGSSVGERDLVVDAIAARGEMIFHGIAVRPGKPTAFATIRTGNGSTPFFGMPGNPTSCLSNAYILLVPFLRALARLPRHTPAPSACRWAGASRRPSTGTSSIPSA